MGLKPCFTKLRIKKENDRGQEEDAKDPKGSVIQLKIFCGN